MQASSETKVIEQYQKIFRFVVFSLPLSALILLSLHSTDWQFIYSLEDPYIHLELAKNIFNGHYGINTTEWSAPSSSILWPFLISIFSPLGSFFEFIPLLLNAVFTISSCYVISTIFREIGYLKNVIFTTTIALSLNVYGLAITGMENSLQVLLTLIILKNLIYKTFNRSLFLSLILLPLIRYEGACISLPVILYLYTRGLKKEAVIIFSILSLAVGSFSLYLYVKNYSLFPSSVLSKSVQTNSVSIIENTRTNIKQYGFLIALSFFVFLYQRKKDIGIGVISLSSILIFMVLGRIGWFGRYEVFICLFVVIHALFSILTKNSGYWSIVFTLPIVFFPLFHSTLHSHQAASNIYRQPYQLSRIANMLNENIAINDLGNVSFRTNVYVLDLWGLGSPEALKNRLSNKNADHTEWISRLMKKNHVYYVAVNDGLFHPKPSNWINIGRLTIHENEYTLGSKNVLFFATSPDHAQKFRSILIKYKDLHMPSRTSLLIF